MFLIFNETYLKVSREKQHVGPCPIKYLSIFSFFPKKDIIFLLCAIQGANKSLASRWSLFKSGSLGLIMIHISYNTIILPNKNMLHTV